MDHRNGPMEKYYTLIAVLPNFQNAVEYEYMWQTSSSGHKSQLHV